ncbi:MAG: hypothetical protein CML29_17505 [Rhizobiales bacterium]|nr:hypothetical protein [Hyphomicrobiales bacterium]
MPAGNDPLEIVEVTIAGKPIRGFTSVSLALSVEKASRSASLAFSDLDGLDEVFPGDEVTITASGDLMLTGYVGTVSPGHDEGDHAVSITIESKALDADEASIVHKSGFVEKKNLKAIAEEFDTCGVGIVCDESFPIEPRSMINIGQTLVGHLRPLARSHGTFLYDTPEGQLRIAKKPRGRHSGALSIGPGGNILGASAQISDKNRHDEVIVRGQSSRGTGAAALRIEAKIKDSGVKRRRPKIIVHESEATPAKLKERAERYMKRAAGYSRTASVTVAGWRDEAGKLFEPHFVIAVNDPRIYTVQDMGIQQVVLTQETGMGGRGTFAVLSLVDPAALNGEPGGGKKQFETPDAEAEVSTDDGAAVSVDTGEPLERIL